MSELELEDDDEEGARYDVVGYKRVVRLVKTRDVLVQLNLMLHW